MSSRAPQVVVVGNGPAAWMAAAALLRAFSHRAIEVTVVDPGAPGESPAAHWTLPSTPGIHRLLGIQEGALLRSCGATFRLGTEHRGWQGEGSRFVHAHGEIGRELQGVPFYKLVISRRLAGDRVFPADVFSLAAMALSQGKFARPMGDGDSLKASFTYGYHLPTAPYVAQLREQARVLGAKITTASVSGMQTNEHGHVTALALSTGERIAGDFFIDCSGKAAVLMSQLPDNQRDDWSSWLPCDRMVSGFAGGTGVNRAATETEAMAAGWWWRLPLLNGGAAGAVYQSSLLGDDAAANQLRQSAGVRDLTMTRLQSGRRRHFWVQNCLALGDTALELEPLVGASLHFVQLGIGVLIELFPLDAARRVEADEYNRVMGEHADALRDFTLAHYRCATRPGAFWDAMRAAPLPQRLAQRLDLFKASGRILVFDHETFEEMDWAWLLLGSQFQPEALEAQTALRAARINQSEAASLASQVNSLAQTMPPHALFLQHASQSRAG